MTDPWFADDLVTVYHGDSLDILKELPDASVDAVVTDPPYGLEFMGKDWDAPWKETSQCATPTETAPTTTATGANDANDAPPGTVTPATRADAPGAHDPAKAASATIVDAPSVGGFQDGNGGNPYSRSRIRTDTRRHGGDMLTANAGFQAWCEQWAAECLRVLKPGGHMLAFGGTRTWHRLACAIEDAGFEIRDSIAWLYGSGFPKSLDVSKAIDKAAGAEREVVGERRGGAALKIGGDNPRPWHERQAERGGAYDVTAPATAEAQKWAGWGTALKPAHEPIVVARKPLTGTVAANVLAHGTGALNIDATRIGTEEELRRPFGTPSDHVGQLKNLPPGELNPGNPGGRWPANVVLDPAAAEELDRQSGDRPGGNYPEQRSAAVDTGFGRGQPTEGGPRSMGDTGGASRFFYVAKANTAERPRIVRDGEAVDTYGTRKRCRICGKQEVNSRPTSMCQCPEPDFAADPSQQGHVAHPTVKPLDLMRWLVRLVTPKGGVVLDPFLGSGTTAEACIIEGFRCVGVERESDYLPLIRARLTKPIQPDLFG